VFAQLPSLAQLSTAPLGVLTLQAAPLAPLSGLEKLPSLSILTLQGIAGAATTVIPALPRLFARLEIYLCQQLDLSRLSTQVKRTGCAC
jgi:hypothetical protein